MAEGCRDNGRGLFTPTVPGMTKHTWDRSGAEQTCWKYVCTTSLGGGGGRSPSNGEGARPRAQILSGVGFCFLRCRRSLDGLDQGLICR